MKSYEIIKKTKITSGGRGYDVFYIKKKNFLGMMYRISNFGGSYNPLYDLFIILSAIVNLVFFVFNLSMIFEPSSFNIPYPYALWYNVGLAGITIFLHHILFPEEFNNIDDAKEFITRKIKIKNFKSSTTKVAKYNIDLDYFEENNRQDRINNLKL